MAERIKGLQIDLSMKDMGIGATLAGVRRSFKTLNSDLKLSRNNFKNSEKSMTSYKNRIRELDGATKQQRNNVKELRAQYQKTAQEQGANSAKAARLRTEYNKQADTLNYLEHELEQTTSSFKNFQKESQAAARVSNSSFGRLGKSFTEMGPKINKVGESMKSVGRSMSMYVTAPVVAGFGLAAKTSIDFDDSMRKVKATSGATGKEFNSLRDKALEMGAKTKFSASESADALNFMALAGWDSKEMMTGISGVMDLAAASGEELGQVSDIVTDSLTAFGMEAKDSGKFADILAQTSSKANTDVKGLGDAFKYAAPVAGALGYSVEDTSVAIGLMSNAGIKGEKAGTALRTMFTNLSKPTKAMKDKMDELGISITDSNGEMLPMRDVMDQLRSSMGGLSKDQQAAAAATIFGKESMSGALAVVNASENDYKKLTKSIDGSSGASKRMAKEMEGGIGGSMRKMKSAVESLAISIGDVVAPFIGKAADAIAGLATKLTNLPGWLQGTIVAFGALAAAIGPLALVVGVFTASLGSIMTTLGPIMVGITKAGGVMKYLSGVMATVTKASPLLGMALKGIGSAATFMLGPWGLVIAGVVALGTALVVAYKKSETFRNIVNGAMNAVKTVFLSLWGVVKTLFNGIKTMWQGDFVSAEEILNKILPPSVVGFIKTTISTIRTLILQVVTAVKDFALKIGAQIMAFWQANGPMIMQAVQNIGNVIKTVFKAIWDFVKPILSALGTGISWTFNTIIVPAVKIAMNIILGIMKLIWPVIKWLIVDTWNAIKGTIQGALDIIMGTIKVFSALFTGNWSAMWSGIKQVVSGVLNMVWGLIQLVFIGKILKVVKLFGGLLKSILSGAWNVVKNIFKTSGNFIWGIVKRIFTSIKNFIMNIFNGVKSITSSAWNFIYTKISGFARSILNSVRSRFNSLKNSTVSIFNNVRNFLYGLWKAVRNKVVSLAQSLWNGVKSKFNSLKNSITSIFNNVRSFLYDIWNKIRNKVVSVATSLWNSVKDKFNSLKNSIKSIIGKVKNNLYDTWDKIWNKVTDVATSLKDKVTGTFGKMRDTLKDIIGKIKGFIDDMVEKVKKGLNKLIGGVNTVGEKLGMGKEMIKPIKLSTGTESTHSQNFVSNGAISKPTMAVVNDKGPGNGSGANGHQELIQRKNGSLHAPQGRNTLVGLDKGDKVINGRNTQSLMSSGAIPKFSRGTSDLLAGLGFKKNKKDDLFGGLENDTKKKAGGGPLDTAEDLWKAGSGAVKEGSKKAVETTLKKAGQGANFLKESMGDVMEWMDKPKKLLEKVIKDMGVNFDFLGGGTIPGELMSGMYKKIKDGIVDLFTSWFSEQGSGDSGFLDLSHGINFGFAQTAAEALAQGYPFPRAHHGLDIGYPYGTKVFSTTGGTATASKGWNGGFGNMVSVKSGTMETIYGHLSKLAFGGSKKVKPGDYIGKSGGDPSKQGREAGSSTGSHLHYEMRWGGIPKDPTSWLKENNGSGKGGGKYGKQIKQALGMAGLPQTSKYIKAWQEQARTESTFNPKAKNPSGASGLVQVKPGTFNQYKLSGHGDIWNPLDNLIAGMRYAKATYGPKKMLDQIGHGLPYKTGGIINSEGMYNLAEDGHSEVVVPLDPARANDAMKLIGYAQSKIKDKKNKRPNDMSNKYGSQSNGGDNTNLLMQMIGELQEQNGYLKEIVRSNKSIEGQPKGFTERDVSQAQGKKAQMMAYNLGGEI
ncbi:phage tail tape measure protein [Staphylococcus equorum]|uniref:phage tail tape measure protein n=2 Tax=Staphylococcus equorum TaxID=246432 RepID=UPI00101D209B|nr:phage tail tape measure protein [Staphylococcus equorum]RYD13627.1 phage tail tape measure protein [Staphylococcus equorum]